MNKDGKRDTGIQMAKSKLGQKHVAHKGTNTKRHQTDSLTRDKGKLRLYTKPEDTSKAIKGKRNRWETKNS